MAPRGHRKTGDARRVVGRRQADWRKNDLLPTVNEQPLLLGYSLAEDSYQQQYWGGYLDEFAVFNVDLTDQEILDLYKTSAAGQSYCATDALCL